MGTVIRVDFTSKRHQEYIDQGFMAYCLGTLLTQCSYPPDSKAYELWHRGWWKAVEATIPTVGEEQFQCG